MLFSVIVPVYNVEKYLCQCIDSILSQTYEDFELILVDDGSSDSSGEICDSYAEKDRRVRVIHKENGGQSTARNVGVRNASGEFAVFLDSDDFFSNANFLEDVSNAVDVNTDVVLFRYCKYYGNEQMDECGISLAELDCSNKVKLLEELIRRDAFFCSCWSKCTRMSILKDYGIEFDINLSCEDMDWYYNVVLAVQNIRVIDHPYVCYRQRENSVTSVFKKKSVIDYIYTIKKWTQRFNDIENHEERFVMLSSLAKLYCNLIILYSRHMKELRQVRNEIFDQQHLLLYTLNPRVKIISKFVKLVGLKRTCVLLKIFDKVR